MGEHTVASADPFERARARVAVALDLDTLEDAVSLTERLRPYIGTFKVGLELYLAEGRRSVEVLAALGVDVFLDLKLHDIPTTVEKSARVVASLGCRYLTLHTSGGLDMVRAGVEGLKTGAGKAGMTVPIAVGVTVLTSDIVADPEELERRAKIGATGGCGALVCAAPDLATVRRAAPGLLTVVPGTRPPGTANDDQSRVTTPADAVALGADLLVVGRPITRAVDPERAAFDITSSLIT